MASLLLIDDSGEWLDLRASWGAGPAYRRKPRLSVAESLVGVVVRRRKPLQVENVQVSSRYQNVELARKENLVSLLSVPLVFGGQSIGALNVYTGQPHLFSNEEIRILSALADLSALAIEKARLYERIVDVEEQMRRNEKLSALGLLAAEVAHEIRNPLTVMKLLYHSLDLRFPEGDPRAKDAEIMRQKMEHLNRIVEQVLDFARTGEPEIAPVHLGHLIEELGLLTRHKLQQQGIRLERRLDPALPPLLADATQLEQAFLNLILNAADAMRRGGRLTITGRALRVPAEAPEPTHVAIEFRDTGAGMTREEQQRAFSARLASHKPQGTGLGLAIVARIIEAHHGEIAVKSRPGQGTIIRIVLPLQPPPGVSV
jgi:signal transduction histidine kinase